jgi:hypothetical protein
VFIPRLGLGIFGLAASDQMDQLLGRRLVAATAVAALLRHCAADLGARPREMLRRIVVIDPQIGQVAAPKQTLRRRRARFAGRGFLANVDVVSAHDCDPLLKSNNNAWQPRKVACR